MSSFYDGQTDKVIPMYSPCLRKGDTGSTKCCATYPGSKPPELIPPVGQGGEWCDHHEGSFSPHGDDLTHQSHTLDRLPEAHLICQDSVHTVLKQHLQINKQWLSGLGGRGFDP